MSALLVSPSPERALFMQSTISSHLYEQLEILGFPEKSLNSIKKCGLATGHKFATFCGDCGHVHVCETKHHCNLTSCPSCSRTRQRRIMRNYMPLMNQYIHNKENFSFYFLTISPRNYDSFEEGIKHIKRSFSRFLRLKYVKERLLGGICALEVTEREKGWHIHVHIIGYGRRLDNQIRGNCNSCNQNLLKLDKETGQLYCANRKCNSYDVVSHGDSTLVKLWKKTSKREVMIDIRGMKGHKDYLQYLTKYISTYDEQFSSDFTHAQYIVGSRKKRLIQTFGLFYGYKPEKQKARCMKCGSFNTEVVADRQVIEQIEASRRQREYEELLEKQKIQSFIESKKSPGCSS